MNNVTNFKKTCIALAVAQAWSIGQVHAATMRVTIGTEDELNGCTFRNAVAAINSGANTNCSNVSSNGFGTNDAIEFDVTNISLEDGQITIESSNVDPTKHVDVKINPNGDRVTIFRSSSNNFRIFQINDSTVSFDNVSIKNGRTTNGGSAGSGAGIFSNNATVVLSNSEVSGNSSSYYGGGVFNSSNGSLSLTSSSVSGNTSSNQGGGVFNSGNISLTTSTVSDNTSSTSGGGIYNAYGATTTIANSTVLGNSANTGTGRGGGILNSASTITTLNNSTVSGNSANIGGGFYNVASTTTLNNSTVSGNSASYVGGGIYNAYGDTTLTNSTVSGNTAANSGGGIYNLYGDTTITNSTVSGNTAANSGGGFASTSAFITITNTMIIGNTAAIASESVDTSIITASNSVFGNSISGFDPIANPADNNIVVDLSSTNLDTVLLPLTNNGGPTLTHALPASSPAIDAGDNANCPATDQRGEARDLQCDIGAYERLDDTNFFVVPLANGKAVIFGL